jgi:hypothetical protein
MAPLAPATNTFIRYNLQNCWLQNCFLNNNGDNLMKIVMIGGTGLIGSKLVVKLRDNGHEATAASRNSGVNTVTGEGMDEALKGASVVVDVSNSFSAERGHYK